MDQNNEAVHKNVSSAKHSFQSSRSGEESKQMFKVKHLDKYNFEEEANEICETQGGDSSDRLYRTSSSAVKYDPFSLDNCCMQLTIDT